MCSQIWNVLLLIGRMRCLAAPTLVLVLTSASDFCVARAPGSDDVARASVGPQRIITIAPNSAEIVCALGACDRIVATSKFCVYPPELADRPRVGGLFDPDLERIVALRPDLLVLRGRSESVEQLCRRQEIAIYLDRTDSLADVSQCIRDLGERLGRARQADQLAKRFQERLDAIRRRVANKPRPRVLVTAARQPDRLADLFTAGKGSFLDELIAIAGGTNVFGDLDMMYPQVSAESVIVRRPDVIIELMPEVRLTPERERQMMDQWREVGPLPAVQNGRVHFITNDHCLIPSPRYVDVIEQVSYLLHPEPPRD